MIRFFSKGPPKKGTVQFPTDLHLDGRSLGKGYA